MKKLVCVFSGSFEIDVRDVDLFEPNAEGELVVIKKASQWLEERGNIDGLLLHSFADAFRDALDDSFEELNLTIED